MTTPNASRPTKSITASVSAVQYNRWVIFSFLGDLTVVILSLGAAYWIRFFTGFEKLGASVGSTMGWSTYAGHIGFGAFLMMLILIHFRVYTRESLLSYTNTLHVILKSSVFWIIGYLAFLMVLRFDPPVSRSYCMIGLGLIVMTLPAWRGILWMWVLRGDRAGCLRQRAIVVGWSERFDQVYEAFQKAPERGFDIVGLVSPPEGRFERKPPASLPVLGSFEMLESLLQMKVCHSLIVADDSLRNGHLVKLSSLCEKEMIDFKLVPTCFRVLLSGLHLSAVGGIPVMEISKLPLHSALNQYLKRTIDVAGAVIGLILSAPLIALFGALVYRESPGPIFYRQRRLGANGKVFEMIKLRSMKIDAEADGKVGWTVKDDPRRLKVGALMRKLNMDEIPQFWNVLKGDMSLVGPRPERPELIEKFKEQIPHYNARHNIKPGITGWAQVNGLRGDTDLSERVRFDLHYIEKWNLIFDFQIMIMTFLKREGAC